MNKLLFFIVAVSCFVACTHKKKYVIIQGRFIGFHKGDKVNYYKPIDGCSNFNIYESTIVINDSGEFKIVLNLDSAGFIKIENEKGRVAILAQNGDSISFKEQVTPYPDSFAMRPIFFTGSNAGMHYVYNKMNANLFYKFNYTRELLDKTYPEGTELYDTLLSGINKYLQPFDSLYEKKKIPKYFLGIIKSDFRNVMFSDAIHNLDILEKKNLWVIPIPEDDLKREVFQNAINKDPYLLHTNFGSCLISDFVYQYNELFRKQDYPIYDTFFYKYGNEFKESAHLEPNYNKYFWADMIIFKTLQNQEYNFSFASIFSYLKKTYPNSSYIEIIEHIHKPNKLNINNSRESNNIRIIDSSGINTSIDKIIKTYFKDTAVFIDLWATWCGPCKDEFRYKNQLYPLLKDKNVKMLYISSDDTSKKDIWKKNIEYYELTGYHVLAGKSLMMDIGSKIYKNESLQYIPRYILFDKHGKMVSNNMPRPSSITTLGKELDSLLDKNNSY